MQMIYRKNTLLAAALALAASPVFAAPAAYKEAAAPWSAEQAVKLPPAITPDFLKSVEKDLGPAVAAALSEKKSKVSALLKRFSTCDLNAEDVKTADKYLNKEFGADVIYFAARGCADLKKAAAGHAAAGPDSSSFSGLEGISASGAIYTYEGAARFFNGADCNGRAAGSAAAGAYLSAAGPAPVSAAPGTALSSNVPALRAETRGHERPADIGKAGFVNQAVAFWSAMRKENWTAFKKADSGSEKAKYLLQAAAGAAFGGLLIYSNLPQVEIAAARLGWDAHNGSDAGTIAIDSAKLAFHSGIFLLAVAPIPMLKVAQAALAREVWAIALLGVMASGPANRFLLHFAD